MPLVKARKHTKLILILLLLAIISASFTLYYGLIQPFKRASLVNIKIDGVILDKPKEIPDFKFIADNGSSFTKQDLENHWTLLFFGFTNCGFVCPTTLTELNKMYTLLEKDSSLKQRPQVIMLSVDPERDSVNRMHTYLQAFNPKFIGLRGSLKETTELIHKMHISAVKMQADGKGPHHYMINHSSEILLINPKAEVQAYLSYPHKAEQLARDYKLIVSRLS